MILSNARINFNSAGGDGGGFHNESFFDMTLTITNSTISDNTATGYGGGYNKDGTITITNSTFGQNTAFNVGPFDAGGGFWVAGGEVNFLDTTVGPNFGGGVHVDGGTLTLINSTLSGNAASITGGGIYNFGTLTILNSTLSGNSSDSTSGAIYNRMGATATIINSTLSGNSAAINGGGIANDGTLTVINSTLSGNSATSSGGGLYNTGTLTLNNSIVANSTSGGDCSTIGTVSAQNSLIEDGLGCVTTDLGGNLTGDPALNGDLTLSASSIAINQGDNSLLPADTFDLDGDSNTAEPLPLDLAGNTRVQQGTVDMGAFESPFTAPVKAMAFLQQPTDTNVNATIAPAVTVQLLDVRGTLVTTDSDSVTLSISTNPGGGSLGGTVSASAEQQRRPAALGRSARFELRLQITGGCSGRSIPLFKKGKTRMLPHPDNSPVQPTAADAKRLPYVKPELTSLGKLGE